MADHRTPQPLDVNYTPLPVQNHDLGLTPPASPGPQTEIPMQELPLGAARPRFQGAALRDSVATRESFASSNYNVDSVNSSVYALNPAPGGTNQSFLGGYRDDPQDGYHDDLQDSPPSPKYLADKRGDYLPPSARSRKWLYVAAGLLGLVIVIAAVVVPVYFTVIKKSNDNKSASLGDSDDPSSTSSPSSSSPGSSVRTVTGGDGSTVTTDDGSTFKYSNSFGGYWYWDPEDPFNNGARAQSWSPALNETFQYGVDVIRGVNIGGWLVTEPFIVPGLYEPYVNASNSAVDEWTLSQNLRSDTSSNGGIGQIENHYKTFITEQDFAEIAGAGLNYVRIPLPWWAIETRGDEPFLEKTAWTYFLKAIQWARKYGLRINLDFHALPGSQNGWNHSGRLGSINMLNGPMGYANAQRSLDYIRILAEFISQPEYQNVVTMFGVTNEPQVSVLGTSQTQSYYFQAYNLVRTASGIGEGNGPFVSFHDGFLPRSQWAGFMPGADRITLDSHPYLCFSTQSSSPLSSFIDTPCTAWSDAVNTSTTAFGLTVAGEWAVATNDCGLYVNGVNLGTRYEGTFAGFPNAVGSCDDWLNWQSWDSTTKQQYMQFAQSTMDALQNWFFWTWKIGNSTVFGTVMAPQWSYQLGLQNGWIPTDPRTSTGKCGGANPAGALAASATGGSGAGQIPASVSQDLAWPPATISNAGAITLLPSYTPTGTVPTLPPPTFIATSGKSSSTVSAGDGWENTADNAGLMTDIAGCSYLDPWVGTTDPPSPLCSGAAAGTKRDALPEPQLTGVPMHR